MPSPGGIYASWGGGAGAEAGLCPRPGPGWVRGCPGLPPGLPPGQRQPRAPLSSLLPPSHKPPRSRHIAFHLNYRRSPAHVKGDRCDLARGSSSPPRGRQAGPGRGRRGQPAARRGGHRLPSAPGWGRAGVGSPARASERAGRAAQGGFPVPVEGVDLVVWGSALPRGGGLSPSAAGRVPGPRRTPLGSALPGPGAEGAAPSSPPPPRG